MQFNGINALERVEAAQVSPVTEGPEWSGSESDSWTARMHFPVTPAQLVAILYSEQVTDDMPVTEIWWKVAAVIGAFGLGEVEKRETGLARLEASGTLPPAGAQHLAVVRRLVTRLTALTSLSKSPNGSYVCRVDYVCRVRVGSDPEPVGVTADKAADDAEPSYAVAVLAPLVMAVARDELNDLPHEFAARAGVSPELVREIGSGQRPAWAADAPEIFRIAGAMRPETADLFWTAATCDLLLSNVLSGDWASAGATAADVLADPGQQETARDLLVMAVQSGKGRLPQPWGTWTGKALLPGGDREVLRARAAELADSGTADSWVGEEILRAFAFSAAAAR